MSIKRYTGSAWSEISTRKRYNGSSWVNLTIGKRYNGSAWVDLWSTTKTYTKTYSLSSAQIYWGSGNKDNQSSSAADLIQGSYGSSLATARRTLLFFPLSTIVSDLSGATVSKVELYLSRLSSSHGESGSYCCVKSYSASSAPSTWTGGDSGDADSGTPVFSRGEGKWITLNTAVGTGLKNGTIKCLCLDADSNYSLSRYGRYSRSATKLRITYTK